MSRIWFPSPAAVLFRYHRQQICAQLSVIMINVYSGYKLQLCLVLGQLSHLGCSSIESFTHGNTSPLFEGNYSYRTGLILRETLWPNQWSHSILLGIKWKIWALSFRYPLVFCWLKRFGYYSLSKSSFFFQTAKNAENWPVFHRGRFFWNFFFKRTPFLDNLG